MLVFILVPVVVTAFLIGKYTERIQWNKLIKTGKIRRPNNPNLNHEDYWANRWN